MRQHPVFFIFIFCLCINPALLQAQNYLDIIRDTIEETRGRGLEVRTNPQRVKVFIDGVERGVTPVRFDTLLAGEYQIRLSRDNFEDKHFNITVFNNSRTVLSARMEAAARPVRTDRTAQEKTQIESEIQAEPAESEPTPELEEN
jgi:hypothetical protein